LVDYELAANENPILASLFEETDTAVPAPNPVDGSNDDQVLAPEDDFSDGEPDPQQLEQNEIVIMETLCTLTS
jgi:hypothetical protein